jgi:hypothetical protein
MMAATVSPKAADLRGLLTAVKELAGDPQVLERMVAVAERNEKAAASARAALRELDAKRREHHEVVTRERAEADAAITQAKARWVSEEAARRQAIEADEAAIVKLKEQAEKDGKAAAALRRDLQARLAKMSELAA